MQSCFNVNEYIWKESDNGYNVISFLGSQMCIAAILKITLMTKCITASYLTT